MENEYLNISINTFGAELFSIKSKLKNIEFIWQGSTDIWKRRSPLLFPIIGNLPNNSYQYNNNSYSLHLHGFAHSEEFILEKNEPDILIFSLSDNKKTIKLFPFKFKLEIIYRVKNKTLLIDYKVCNTDDKVIYFMIGAHPGFNCPIESGISLSGYYLEFEKLENVKRYYLENGMVTGLQTVFLNNQKNIALNKNLFNNNAILLSKLKSKYISIRNVRNKDKLVFDFSEFPHLALWSVKNKVPFICIEPWSSIPVEFNGIVDIGRNEKFIQLKSGDMWYKGLKIIFDF